MTTNYRYIGTTDETTACERCGRIELRNTVVLMPLDIEGNDDGEPVYYGSSCAAKALAVKGGSRAVLQAARAAHRKTLDEATWARHMLDVYSIPAEGVVTTMQIYTAVGPYIENHRKAIWAARTTMDEWVEHVMDMVARCRRAIADAARIAA